MGDYRRGSAELARSARGSEPASSIGGGPRRRRRRSNHRLLRHRGQQVGERSPRGRRRRPRWRGGPRGGEEVVEAARVGLVAEAGARRRIVRA